MCWFHVVKMVREYLMSWTSGSIGDKKKLIACILKDMRIVRGARTQPDFSVRSSAVQDHWRAAGVDQVTQHLDKNGAQTHFTAYWSQQLVETTPEWYVGAAGIDQGPGTNNAVENRGKLLRGEYGNKVAGLSQLLPFMLSALEAESLRTYACKETRRTNQNFEHRFF